MRQMSPTNTTNPPTRVGLGLAALGRPGYLNLGRAADLPAQRSVPALRERTFQVLDAAWDAGIRRVDTARSYGRAEEFLADWIAARDHSGRPVADELHVSSKWGYTYTADWQVDAAVHETKTHDEATFRRQLGESRGLLAAHLELYQVHSLTPQSPLFTDTRLLAALSSVRASGLALGFSTSGPQQAEAINRALALTVDGVALFGSVQSTWNLLEPSAGAALAAAAQAGAQVVVKEAVANGRLTSRAANPVLERIAQDRSVSPDAVALAAVLGQPWCGVVLSGAVSPAQLAANLTAVDLLLDADELASLASLAEPAEQYWSTRSGMTWA